jgi:mono/diheme cytochrome c family protein
LHKRNPYSRWLLCLLSGISFLALSGCFHEPSDTEPDITITTTSQISGSQVYLLNCAQCHGIYRQGVPAVAPPVMETSPGIVDRSLSDLVSFIGMHHTGAYLFPLERVALAEFLKTP